MHRHSKLYLILAALLAVIPAWPSSIGNGAGAVTINGTNCSVNASCTVVPVMQFAMTNSVNLTGVAVETSMLTGATGLGSLTLPANFFSQAGSILRMHWQFMVVNTGTSTTNIFRLKLGGTTIATWNTGGSFAATAACNVDVTATADTVGVGGTIQATAGQLSCGLIGSTGSASVAPGSTAVTTVGINTTGTLAVDITDTPGATTLSLTTTQLILTNF